MKLMGGVVMVRSLTAIVNGRPFLESAGRPYYYHDEKNLSTGHNRYKPTMGDADDTIQLGHHKWLSLATEIQ